VEAVVLVVSWLSQVVTLLTTGGQLSGDMLTILTGQAEAAALQLPVPQLTAQAEINKVAASVDPDGGCNQSGGSSRPLESVSAKEIVLRVLQGQAAAAGLEALGALLVTPVHYVAPERDPLGVMVPAAELQQQVAAAGAQVRLLARASSQ
jgi:hypothetical protein